MAEATPIATAISSTPPTIVHGGDLNVESTPQNKVEGMMSDLAPKTEESSTKMQMTVTDVEGVMSVRRVNRSTVVNVEKPSWLPEGWELEIRVREDGPTTGSVDLYYYEPVSGTEFRSKAEVQYFLETGGKRKKENTGTGCDATTSETPNSKKQKSTDFSLDSENPPESVCWIQTDTYADTWEPYINGVKVPPAQRQEWDAVFSAAAKLGERNNS